MKMYHFADAGKTNPIKPNFKRGETTPEVQEDILGRFLKMAA